MNDLGCFFDLGIWVYAWHSIWGLVFDFGIYMALDLGENKKKLENGPAGTADCPYPLFSLGWCYSRLVTLTGTNL